MFNRYVFLRGMPWHIPWSMSWDAPRQVISHGTFNGPLWFLTMAWLMVLPMEYFINVSFFRVCHGTCHGVSYGIYHGGKYPMAYLTAQTVRRHVPPIHPMPWLMVSPVEYDIGVSFYGECHGTYHGVRRGISHEKNAPMTPPKDLLRVFPL